MLSLRKNVGLGLGVVIAATLVSCAHKPSNVQPLAASTDPTAEIQKTEDMLNEARAQQQDVLSPRNFTEAEEALEKAKKYKDKDKSTEKILEQVSYSRAWLNQASEKSKLTESVMKEITDARAGAMKAGANKSFSKEWAKAGDDLEDVTRDIEKGDLKPAEKKGKDITKAYRDLERRAVDQEFLGKAHANIKGAQEEKANKLAPRTYGVAISKMAAAEKLIAADPRNTDAIRAASEEADQESMHLLSVTKAVKAGNSEELVLLAERQKSQISNLRAEGATTAQELEQSRTQLTAAEQAKVDLARKEALLSRAESVRATLRPSEAEVFPQGENLVVRLKGLQFPSSQANLTPKNTALLARVKAALAGIEIEKIRVEGHTDSTGNADKNRELSQKRAEAVEKYILASGTVPSEKVEAVGLGYDVPIADNTTKSGRAQNRRIDLVIETKEGGAMQSPSRTE